MAIVVAEENAEPVKKCLEEMGETLFTIGKTHATSSDSAVTFESNW